MNENFINDEPKYHKKYLGNGITEVTAWSLIPIKENFAHKLHIELGINSPPCNFTMAQKKDGAYVSTWSYCDYERVEID
jgi:hypothetical protein